MSTVAICTDSSALFPDGVVDHFGVVVVPIAVALDGVPFDERRETLDRFYARLAEGAHATTSLPSPGAFLEAYSRMAEEGAEELVSIHLDARVSGTVSSAELAARDAPIPVTVVDTPTVSFGVGVCIRAAAEAIESGSSSSEAAAAATRVGEALRNGFVAPGGPSGRVPEAAGWSVLEHADGSVAPLAGCDDLGDAIETMVVRVAADDRPIGVGVGHAGGSTAAAADALAGALAERAHVDVLERYRVGAAVGAHTGAASFGAFWWPARLGPTSGRRAGR
jgi:fatty acid-binding protein DegV